MLRLYSHLSLPVTLPSALYTITTRFAGDVIEGIASLSRCQG